MLLPRSLLALALSGAVAAAAEPDGTIPITTRSAEARADFLAGRKLQEEFKAREAHARYVRATEEDPTFAWAWLQRGATAGSAKDFFAGLEKAVSLAGGASEGERLVIQAADAQTKSDAARGTALLERLVAAYPKDARAHAQLGGDHFGRQDWEGVVREMSRAIELDPGFSTPYNQLGYAYRFQGKFAEAEKAFQRYAELLPNDPNPHDSLAELLMKTGRFEESIARYRKALAADPAFMASYVGIASDQVLLGQGDAARKTLQDMLAHARTPGEKRQVWFWMSQTYTHEERWADAIRCLGEEKKIADAIGDGLAASQDVTFVGVLLLGAGKPAEAAAKFSEGMKLAEAARVSEEIKSAARRGDLYNRARVALLQGDLASARALSEKYAQATAEKKVPFEQRQAHELAGMVALQEKAWDRALSDFAEARVENPRAVYLSGLAWAGKGDTARATEAFREAANYNSVTNPNWAFVRPLARRQLARS